METMYTASINSISTTLSSVIDENVETFAVTDLALLPTAPNLLTIGFTSETPETILLLSKNDIDKTITVQRGFQGIAKKWAKGIKIARVFTAYDHDKFKENIEKLFEGGTDSFITTDKFLDENYIYIIGDISSGWKVNRYDILNNKTYSSGTSNKPTTLNVRGFMGSFELRNMNSTKHKARLHLSRGRILVDETCTEGFVGAVNINEQWITNNGGVNLVTNFSDLGDDISAIGVEKIRQELAKRYLGIVEVGSLDHTIDRIDKNTQK